MKIFRHIFPVLSVLVLLSSCSSGDGRVISRGDLAEIYAQMLLTDQWLAGKPSLRKMADTSLVYEPILEQYGYTKEDYVRTVDKYMDDPERYSRILRTTVSILDDKLNELEERKKSQESQEDIRKRLEKLMEDVKVNIRYSLYYKDTTAVCHRHLSDSLRIDTDSLDIYRLIFVDTRDSIIDGLRLVARDTVQVADTLDVADSLLVATADTVDIKSK